MATSEILDTSIKLLRANARTMILIVLAFVLPVEFAIGFLERNLNGGEGFLQVFHDPTAASAQNSPSSIFTVLIVSYVAFWIVVPLVCAGVSRVVMASYLGGEMRAKEAIVAALKRAPAIIVATVIIHLIEVVSLVGAVVGAVFVMPLFLMTAPAISLEGLGPFAGIKRSVSMARRRYWPTVGIALLSGRLAYLLNEILGLVPNIVALFIGFRWGWLIVSSGGVLVALVSVSMISIVATLVYLDSRIRLEGFDLQVTASHFDSP